MIRAVVDTNVWVSALIKPLGRSGELLAQLRARAFTPICSEPIIAELIETLSEPTLADRYGIESDDIEALVDVLRLTGELAQPTRRVQVCRDADDDKFVEAALAGDASLIVTGDKDLLDLQEFENIRIITLREFLSQTSQE